MKWNYVDTDGNPTKEGVYWTTLIYPEYKKGKETGRTLCQISSRYFGNIDKEPGLINWKMKDQKDEGLIWTEETGSSMDETVWAWAEMEETPFPERLPAGVVKDIDG